MENEMEKQPTAEESSLNNRKRIASAMAYILAVTLSVMCVLLAFYAQDGYHQIGEAKFAVYKVTMLFGFSAFLGLGAVYVFFSLREKKSWERNLSVTDYCVLAYFLFSTISVASGGFFENALWGSFGWNMDVAA